LRGKVGHRRNLLDAVDHHRRFAAGEQRGGRGVIGTGRLQARLRPFRQDAQRIGKIPNFKSAAPVWT
jgi:hypothetical protein